jgi:hypothetical protein
MMCHQGPYPEDEARTRALPWLPEGPALATRGPCPGYPRALPWLPEGPALATRGWSPAHLRAKPWLFRAAEIIVIERLVTSFRRRPESI